jgi:hypothetical protein
VWTILAALALAIGFSNVDGYYYTLENLARDAVITLVVWAVGLAVAIGVRAVLSTPANRATATADIGAADEIAKLAALRDTGIITEEEFGRQKSALLASQR